MHTHSSDTHQTDGDIDCREGRRNRFFRGKQMRAQEFALEQRYGIERRRLLNRAVVGWGVVHGFKLAGPVATGQTSPAARSTGGAASTPVAIGVGRGFALDRAGREIVLTNGATIEPKNTFVLSTANQDCLTLPLENAEAGRYVLSIHYAERRFGQARLQDECGCDDRKHNFVCETAVFSLTPLGRGACPCGEEPCRHPCRCGTTDSCGSSTRGPHACICHWLLDDDGDDPGELCEWNGFHIDPSAPVALACVTVGKTNDKCAPVKIVVDDACGPRRLVKNNDLLYDLMRGCDLTRISNISWSAWHRKNEAVKWADFAAMFKSDGTTDFVVEFSAPVQMETLRRDAVVVTVVTVEQATGWRLTRRIPLSRIDHTSSGKGELPAGTTDRFRIKVRSRWVRDEIEGGQSWLTDREFTVEIEVRGDLILDCHGRPIDGNAIGLQFAPSGNGTPGGTYVSCFHVEKRPSDEYADESGEEAAAPPQTGPQAAG